MSDALSKFMTRAQSAARQGSNEIRIPAAEALELVAAVGKLTAVNVELTEQLRKSRQEFADRIRIDGGTLS